MAAKHIAWFRFKEGVTEERVEAHLAAVRALKGQVPEVLEIECAKSYTDRAGGLTHGIVVTLPGKEALPRYLNHPVHVPVAEALVADIAELKVMDLDFGD